MMKLKNREKDIRGKVFGEHTVIGPTDRFTKCNKRYWICQCSCGNVTEVTANSLKTGNSTKCDNHPLNDFEIFGDYALVDVSTPSHTNKKAKIDLDDLEKIVYQQGQKVKSKWLYHDSAPGSAWGKYVVDSRRKRRMHREIVDCPPHMLVDHINGDTLDNRKRNLAIVTAAQNNRNMRRHKLNAAGATGVILKDGLWVASIQIDHQKIFLGSYNTKEEASAAYVGAKIALGFSENHGRGPDA